MESKKKSAAHIPEVATAPWAVRKGQKKISYKMCYSPLSIINRRMDFRPECDRLSMKVPCGRCIECEQDKKDDWFVRLYYEKRRHKSGVVLFPTFSFDESLIPRCESSVFNSLVDASHQTNENFSFYSFDKKTFQNFLKKLRVTLKRLGLNDSFKYFVVCEYGHDNDYFDNFGKKCKGTIRPHYHVLFFLPEYVDESTFRTILQYCWATATPESSVPEAFKRQAVAFFSRVDTGNPINTIYCPFNNRGDLCRYIARYKKGVNNQGKPYSKIQYLLKRGNVTYSRKYGGIVSTDKALKYVTKYLCKHEEFERIDGVNVVRNLLKNLPKASNLDSTSVLYKAVRYLNNVFPFHLNSSDFGGTLFDQITAQSELVTMHENVLKNVLVPNHVQLEGQDQFYHIPQYIINRLFYYYEDKTVLSVSRNPDGNFRPDVVDYRKRILTPLGSEVLKLRAEYKLLRLTQFYKNYVQDEFFNIVNGFVLSEDDKTVLESCFRNIRKQPIDYELLACYKLFYQGVLMRTFKGVDFSTFTKQDYIDNAIDLEYWRINTYNDTKDIIDCPPSQSNVVFNLFDKDGYFNNLDVFDGYDEYLLNLDSLKSIISKYSNEAFEKKSSLAEELRKYYLNLNY